MWKGGFAVHSEKVILGLVVVASAGRALKSPAQKHVRQTLILQSPATATATTIAVTARSATLKACAFLIQLVATNGSRKFPIG